MSWRESPTLGEAPAEAAPERDGRPESPRAAEPWADGAARPWGAEGHGRAAPPADVLVVDDEPGNLLVLEAILGGLGQEVVTAGSGAEALRRVLERDFALILMDAHMPGMDGFETAELIRQRDRSRYTPIIFVTAFERTDAQMFRGYSAGAVDFLFKPIVPEVLRSKVSFFVQMHQMTQQVKRQAEALRAADRREHERALAAERERFERERLLEQFRLAEEIQQRLFPPGPPEVAGYDIAGASYPADATGGDYYDYLPAADGALGVAVGDVCGHGIGPALLMAATRAYLRGFNLTHRRVGEILRLTNRALAADVSDGRFVTLFLGRLDPAAGSFAYASAGHHRAYILDADGGVKRVLESTALPLGLAAEAEFPEAPPVELGPGDLVFLLTDGVVEATGLGERPFGVERALETVARHRDRPAREVVEALYRAVRAHAGGREQRDDITAVVIKRAGGAAVPA